MVDRTHSFSRRKFLKAIGRLSAGGILGYLGFRLLRQSSTSLREICINRGICNGCTALSDCGLPPAISRKRAAGSGTGAANDEA